MQVSAIWSTAKLLSMIESSNSIPTDSCFVISDDLFSHADLLIPPSKLYYFR